MVNFEKIPRLEKIELAKSIMAPIKEYYQNPKNIEKFESWKQNQSRKRTNSLTGL